MRISFTATEAEFDDDDFSLIAGVSCTTGDRIDHALSFDRLGEVAAKENPAEDGGINLQYNDQANSGYNCIAACTISRATLHVELSQQLGALTGIHSFDVTLEVNEADFEPFIAGMCRVFRGTDLLFIEL